MRAYFEFHDRFNAFDQTVDHTHVDDEGHTHTFRAARPRANTAKEVAAERKAGIAWVRKRRTVLRAQNRNVPAFRAYDRGQANDKSKAIEYARWLAARDGVELVLAKDHGWDVEPAVRFKTVMLAGFKTATLIAESVSFGNVTILLPHTDYDPTIMPDEVIEADAPATPVATAVEPAQAEEPATEPSVDVFADNEAVQARIADLRCTAETGADWAEICRLEALICDGPWFVAAEPATDADEQPSLQDAEHDTLEALGAILVDDFDADDSGACEHRLPCRLGIGVLPALTLGDVLGELAAQLT